MAKQLSDGDDTGTKLGQSATDPLGFFGATATVQPASVAAVTTTAAVSISATQWGYATSTQANAVTTALSTIHANLISLGLLRS
jgi:UDP-N-acetyl-D-mannosaminuronic acid transferase (WecB/TagA/CpsF family)